MDKRHLDEELLGVTDVDLMSIVLPLAAFEVDTVDVASALRLLLDVLVAHLVFDIVAEGKLINSDRQGSRIVLEGTSEESLGEEES